MPSRLSLKRPNLLPIVMAVLTFAIVSEMVELQAVKTALRELSDTVLGDQGYYEYEVNDYWLERCVQDLSRQPSGPFHTLRPEYAIGDCIKLCERCDWGLENNTNTNVKFPNWTIAGSYARMACPYKERPEPNKPHLIHKFGGNFRALEKILTKYGQFEGFERPDPDAILLHLRLGDVIERTNDTVVTMLTKGGNPAHHKAFSNSIKSFYEYLENIEEANTTKVIIVGGSHRPMEYKKSRVYAGCLEKALRRSGKDVTMSLDGGDADTEFYYMSYAKKVVVSPGGFSRLIGQMVKYHGGKIIGRTF